MNQTNAIKKIRESNIELLRLILMFMILMLHAYGQTSGLLNKVDNLALFIPELLISSLAVVAVNCFVFISGYFGMRFNLRSFLGLITQLLFYSTGITLVFVILGEPVSAKFLLRSLFPVSGRIWWFMSAYVALYFIAPFMNKGLESLNKRQHLMLILALVWLNTAASFYFHNDSIASSGSSVFNFIVIYVVARYIYIYNIKFKQPLLLYLLISGFCFL